MDEHTVKAFLRYPRASLVEFALVECNLTAQEAMVLALCGRQKLTQEQAAEQMDRSVNAVQKWYRAAIEKCCKAWHGWEWIYKVLG